MLFLQPCGQGRHFPDGLHEGLCLGELGADVHLQPLQMDVRQCAGGHFIQGFDLFEIHPEFVLRLAGGDILVRARLHVGVDADGYRGREVHGGGNIVDRSHFRLGFHVEAVNALLQGIADFLFRLSYAGVRAFGRVSSGLDNAEEFPSGHDVKSRSIAGHEVQDGNVGARLHRVRYFRIQRFQGFPQAVEVAQNGMFAVNVQGSPLLVRQFLEVDVFTVQQAVFVSE